MKWKVFVDISLKKVHSLSHTEASVEINYMWVMRIMPWKYGLN